MRLFYFLFAFFIVSCEANLCDCIHAEKKPDGSIKNEKLKIHCDELMSERKKELERLSSPQEQKELISTHKKEVQDCLEQ